MKLHIKSVSHILLKPWLVAVVSLFALVVSHHSSGQCNTFASGLREPLGTTLSNQGNLLVAETGTAVAHTGRISIIDPTGNRRTLLDGLPTGVSDAGEPSGPDGVFIRGRTLYVTIGTGDTGRPGPFPGTTIVNPNPVSSPIFSSVLSIQFSAAMEQTTTGVTLTAANEQALANGETVRLTSDGREWMTIRMLVNFPNYVSFPLPTFADNIQLSNPFDLVALEDTLYVVDGGRNRVWQVDLLTGAFSTLVTFPAIPNPLFGVPGLPGGPFLDAVPTGITTYRGQLFVTLFRGAPFPPGTSTVEQIDPVTGTDTTLIAGRKTAIDVLTMSEHGQTRYLVLQHASAGPFFASPGQVLRFDSPTGAPTVLADCFTRPTSMTLDSKRGVLYVSEIGGRIVKLAVTADTAFAPTLRNISSRGRVESGDNVMIAGFVIEEGSGGGTAEVVIRAIGPTLGASNVANPLHDPVLTLYDGTGKEIARNDDWKGDAGKPSQQAAIEALGLAPADPAESVIIASLPPGNYTGIVRGKGSDAGVALVEVYRTE